MNRTTYKSNKFDKWIENRILENPCFPDYLHDCLVRCAECRFKYDRHQLTKVNTKYLCKFCRQEKK